jgi:hypothetical protein
VFTDADTVIDAFANLVLTVSGMPDWLGFDPATSKLTGTPTIVVGAATIVITCTDTSGSSITDTFVLTTILNKEPNYVAA